jgi:uncharacterized protein YdiU (UPF0061 family)
VINDSLAGELGLDPDALRSAEGVAALVGNSSPSGAANVALAYAGHQFGSYSPRLGDGRALLLGEIVDGQGRRFDVHLKGSGRTPFARGGDGKAAVGPMLREYIIGEALHALGIPTTRALAVIATGEDVLRERPLPGAVLARVAASHIRVGTFQYAAATGDGDLLRRLADHAITRHHPAAADAEQPHLAFLAAVADAQASLIAKWMLVGFVHGVMNTDNMTISGESIDFGPCAFVDAHHPSAVFSSIDQLGRYAYGNQPHIALWNLARLAETLLPLVAADADTTGAVESVTEVLHQFLPRYEQHWLDGMRAKLGLRTALPDDRALVDDLLARMTDAALDHTGTFRALARVLRGAEPPPEPLLAWMGRWRARLAVEGSDDTSTAAAIDRVNPLYIARNHLVEAALATATDGDLTTLHELVELLRHPFDESPGRDRYALPAPREALPYVTYCGT